MITDEELARFRADGFAAAGPIGDRAQLDWIGELCNRAFERRYGLSPDQLDQQGGSQPALMTIVSPEGDEPGLQAAAMVADAHEMAARIFDVRLGQVLVGWRLFVKPAGGAGTAWHQDAAYRPPPHRGATFWTPIDAPDRGRMSLRFLRGTHAGPLRSHDWHEGHLSVADVDEADVCTSPVGVGEASVHHCLTLHAAGPNTTAKTRRAVALVCQIDA